MIDTLRTLFRRSPAIGPVEAHEVAESDAVLLDVRTSREWAAGHAAYAFHVPLSQLGRQLDKLPREHQIIAVCRSGHRSAVAAKMLISSGFQVTNLRGGMTAWAAAGLPVVTSSGTPGKII
jgi:rhodanese-related sulfurtransferase